MFEDNWILNSEVFKASTQSRSVMLSVNSAWWRDYVTAEEKNESLSQNMSIESPALKMPEFL